MSTDKKDAISRRTVVKTVMIGGAATMVMLPGKWTKPVVDMVVTPAHASSSAPATTISPTTTPALPTTQV